GGWLTASTWTVALTEPDPYGLLPPPVPVSAPVVPSARPSVVSQALNVIVAVPKKYRPGRKRTRFFPAPSASSSVALDFDSVPKLVQVVPPSREYCQEPLTLPNPVNASPLRKRPWASEYRLLVATRASTVVPGFEFGGTFSVN